MTGGKKAVGSLGVALGLGLLAAAFLMGGCSPPPPCEIGAAEVQDAQRSAKAAEQTLQDAQQERADLEAELRARRDELRKAETRLDELQQERRGPK